MSKSKKNNLQNVVEGNILAHMLIGDHLLQIFRTIQADIVPEQQQSLHGKNDKITIK